MSCDVRVYPLDILERCERIMRYVEGLDQERCLRDILIMSTKERTS